MKSHIVILHLINKLKNHNYSVFSYKCIAKKITGKWTNITHAGDQRDGCDYLIVSIVSINSLLSFLQLRHLSPSSNRVFLFFSLLDKANLNDLPIVVGQKGKDLQEAILLLQKLVDSGKFSIQFKNPKNDKEVS